MSADRIAELEEEVRQLRSELSACHQVPELAARFGIRPQSAKLLGLLVRREFVSHAMVQSTLWPDPDDMPSSDVAKTVVYALRKALPQWAQIRTHHGQGYSMRRDVRRRLLAELGLQDGGADV